MFTRRRFLTLSASSAVMARLATVAPIAVPITLSSAIPARAWGAAALAIASTVAGMIAAHNRRSVELLYAEATYRTLMELVAGVSDLQSKMHDVVDRLIKIDDKIDVLLGGPTRELQYNLAAVAKGYFELIRDRDQNLSDEEWRALPTTRETVSQLINRLDTARQNLQVRVQSDADTALVVAQIGFVDANLRNLRGDGAVEMLSYLENTYVPWMSDILSEKTGSASWQLVQASEHLRQLSEAAKSSVYGKKYGVSFGRKVAACAGVNDTEPAQEVWESSGYICPEHTDITGKTKVTPASFTPTELAFCVDKPRRYLAKRIPAKLRGEYRAVVWTGFSEHELEVHDPVLGNLKTGVMVLKFVEEAVKFGTKGSSDIPDDGQCAVEVHNMPDGATRNAYMNGTSPWVNAAKDVADFNAIIAEINLERTKLAFVANAIAATISASAYMDNVIATYRRSL